jgi:hypothetical protein
MNCYYLNTVCVLNLTSWAASVKNVVFIRLTVLFIFLSYCM